MAATLKRTGLHRAECEHACGAYLYATVAMLERHGCPVCSCGGRFIPDHPDLAATVCPDVADVHPAVQAYRAELARILQGRKGSHAHTNYGEWAAKTTDGRKDPGELAAERVARAMRDRARERRLSALRRPVPVHVDPIPF